MSNKTNCKKSKKLDEFQITELDGKSVKMMSGGKCRYCKKEKNILFQISKTKNICWSCAVWLHNDN